MPLLKQPLLRMSLLNRSMEEFVALVVEAKTEDEVDAVEAAVGVDVAMAVQSHQQDRPLQTQSLLPAAVVKAGAGAEAAEAEARVDAQSQSLLLRRR